MRRTSPVVRQWGPLSIHLRVPGALTGEAGPRDSVGDPAPPLVDGRSGSVKTGRGRREGEGKWKEVMMMIGVYGRVDCMVICAHGKRGKKRLGSEAPMR